MAKQSAPVELTGGEVFNYEDRVAARFLVDMLPFSRTTILNPSSLQSRFSAARISRGILYQ
jgi:hypothetical protein